MKCPDCEANLEYYAGYGYYVCENQCQGWKTIPANYSDDAEG